MSAEGRRRGVDGAVELTDVALELFRVDLECKLRASAEGCPISEEIRAGISVLVLGASSLRGGS